MASSTRTARWSRVLLAATLLGASEPWPTEAGADLALGMAAIERDDCETGIDELTSAAESGDPVAQFHLALLYYRGEGTPQDFEAAHRWFRQAADQGSVDAAYALAIMYANAEGAQRDLIEACVLSRGAARHGHADARKLLYQLGLTMTPAQAEEARHRADAERAPH